jgi:tetratricopeptide (TPR) repeat protein
MNLFLRKPLTIVPLLLAASVPASRAADASVDQLIKKLPPPEKVAQSAVGLDPALRDPLAKQVVDSAKAMNFGSAYSLSQKLASKYPKSAIAQCLRGRFALVMHRYPEAAAAYRRAISDQPNLAAAYLGLGLSEAGQQNFRAAMSDFREVTRVSPNADAGWIFMSACAERLGRKGESLDYARHATSVAPSSAGAWYQLSREEGLSGNQQAAKKALDRANSLRQKSTRSKSR